MGAQKLRPLISGVLVMLALAACAKGDVEAVTPKGSGAGTFSALATNLPFGDKSAYYDVVRRYLWVISRAPGSGPGGGIATVSRVDPTSGATSSWPIAADLARFVRSSASVDDAGMVWIGLGRSVLRFDPSTVVSTRWDLPGELAALPAGPDDGGIVAVLPTNAGIDVLVRGLPRLLMLTPGAASPWTPIADLSVTPYDFSELIPTDNGAELVTGVETLPGQAPRPAVARLAGRRSVTLPGLSACRGQQGGGAVCTFPDGSLSLVSNGRSLVTGASTTDVRLRLAGTSPRQFWTWSEGHGSALVVRVDTTTGQQVSYPFPLELQTVQNSKSLTSGVGGVPAGGTTKVTVTVDPAPQALIWVGSRLWVLTRYGARAGDEGVKSPYASAYRLDL